MESTPSYQSVGFKGFVPSMVWAASRTVSGKGKKNPSLMVDLSETPEYKQIHSQHFDDLEKYGVVHEQTPKIITILIPGDDARLPFYQVFRDGEILGRVTEYGPDDFRVLGSWKKNQFTSLKKALAALKIWDAPKSNPKAINDKHTRYVCPQCGWTPPQIDFEMK